VIDQNSQAAIHRWVRAAPTTRAVMFDRLLCCHASKMDHAYAALASKLGLESFIELRSKPMDTSCGSNEKPLAF
jgi:hypothetical protein